MKIKILILATASLFLSSCTQWLDVKPEGSPNDANFWKTEADYSNAMLACYEQMNWEETWGQDMWWEQGAADDTYFCRSDKKSIANLRDMELDGVTERQLFWIYEAMYQMMARANNVIYHGRDLKNERIRVHVGEAYFMRAFTHFMIAYRYGRQDNGVPFDRYEDYNPYISKIPEQRASVIDNYKLIIEDLDQAIARLPHFKDYAEADYGRPCKDAAIALKVKVYAYWAEYDESKWALIPPLVDQIENEGARGLEDKFADVFKVENEWGKEYLWSVNSHGKRQAGSMFPGILLDNKGWGKANGWGEFKPTLELWAEYDDADERRGVTLLSYGDEFIYFGETRKFYSDVDFECGFHVNKYMDGYRTADRVSENGDRPTTDLNVPIMRFAEMLLFKAEALIEQGKGTEGAKVLNRLTKRAGLGNLYADATMKDLMHERRCELAFEWIDRLKDLKRWATKYPEAKTRLEAPKHGLKYVDRSNPDSPLDEEKGKEMNINGKAYKGVIEIVKSKTYDPNIDVVFPYGQNEVVKAQGKLKQNKGY